jgi:hypothetical protein
MPAPDLLEKPDLPLDIAGRLHMDAAENIGKLIDARVHIRTMTIAVALRRALIRVYAEL